MSDILFLDFETRSCVDLKEVGADNYARHSSTEVIAIGYAFNDEQIRIIECQGLIPERLIDHVQYGGKVVAHNAHFEWLIWNKVLNFLPTLYIEQMSCTMVRAYAMGLPGSLEKASAALGLATQKDSKGQRVMLQLSKPKSFDADGKPIWWDPIGHKDKYERMYSYCAQDVEVERQLHSRLPELSHSERELWHVDHRINQRGVYVSIKEALKALDLVDSEEIRLNEEIRRLTANQVATSSCAAQLASWLRVHSIDTEGVTKSDIDRLLKLKNLSPIVKQVLGLRQNAAKSSTKKLNALVYRTCADKRLRSTMQFHGASTGRWAGRGFQLHNLPRPKLSQSEIDGIFDLLKDES